MDAPEPVITLDGIFKAFAQFNATPGFDGKSILLSQSDDWMAQAKLFDKKLNLIDTGINFSTFK